MKKQITYTEHNGLYYPDLALPEQTNYPLGKYANKKILEIFEGTTLTTIKGIA